ncbi:sulfotransferase [Alteromonas sp. A081]|uniref:sulfotransferase n=1 Tax=Alteromonas sp. A081 TaxID=3410269 RepID=UPI003B981DC1
MVKNLFKSFILKCLTSYDIAHELRKNVYGNTSHAPLLDNFANPYNTNLPSQHKQNAPIFITGRFRSGSSTLWNMFRQINSCTSYYEPLNERQWFSSKHRGNNVDETHLNVKNYWTEYEGLESLSQYFETNWSFTNLLMDERANNPKMKMYLSHIIRHCNNRAILQFNRADFRLPWLKKNFPTAQVIHLYRNPRDQWLSFLGNKELMNKNDVENTYVDKFYLDTWCRDLEKAYPMLNSSSNSHPYNRFYTLWKLSFNHGRTYSDYSICFEDLIRDTYKTWANLTDFLDLALTEEQYLQCTSVVESVELEKWKKYADEEWFLSKEREVESQLELL